MLHLFMEKGAWFRAKSHGYGAGLPFKWQGWALLIVHAAMLVGLGLSLQERPWLMIAALAIMAAAPIPIYAARTEGGWRWRWGAGRK